MRSQWCPCVQFYVFTFSNGITKYWVRWDASPPHPPRVPSAKFSFIDEEIQVGNIQTVNCILEWVFTWDSSLAICFPSPEEKKITIRKFCFNLQLTADMKSQSGHLEAFDTIHSISMRKMQLSSELIYWAATCVRRARYKKSRCGIASWGFV